MIDDAHGFLFARSRISWLRVGIPRTVVVCVSRPAPQGMQVNVGIKRFVLVWIARANFENERVSARLSYTYRSDWFVTFDRSTPLNQEALSSVDASLVVNVLDGVAVTFDALNLTNEKTEQFAGTVLRPRAIYDNGRVYYAGVRLKF